MSARISRLTALCAACEPHCDWQCCGPHPRRYVYFAHVGGYVKVGFSEAPDERVRQVRGFASGFGMVAAPRFRPDNSDFFHPHIEPLHALHAVEVISGRDGERQAHQALADFRDVGEWFVAEPSLVAWIAERQAGEGFPLLPRDGGAWERPQNDLERAEFERLRVAMEGMEALLSPSP